MKINEIDHIAINVIDIEESKEFYSRVMGFEFLKKIDNGDTNLIHMKINKNSTIELFEHQKIIEYSNVDDTKSGIIHFALTVENIEEWNEYLNDNKVEFTLDLCSLDHIGKKVLLFKDPNGVVIELSESI